MKRAIVSGVCVFAILITPVRAQDVTIQVTVTSSADNVLVIDHGRNSGLIQGLRVRIFPPDGTEFEGVIRSVSPDNARVDFPSGIAPPPTGTQGEVVISAPDQGPSTPELPGDVPEHPPWTRQLEILGPDVPLLAPIKRERAEDRPPSVDGRAFLQYDFTRDRGDGRESDFYVGRMGVTLKATNLFRLGEQLKLSAQGSVRGQDIEDEESDSETEFRLDRLSYTFGGHEYSPYRAEVGRFFSLYVPELGLIDGAEAAVHYRNGLRLGGGVGAYPLPFPERQTGDDVGFHVFADYLSKGEKALAATLAYQKTWHKGEPDRDLIVGRLSLRPSRDWWISGSLKADFYSGSDTIKNETVGLTSLYAQARYSPGSKGGLGVSFSHFTWPELLREEYSDLPEELVKDGRVDRVELSGWYKLFNEFRLTGRVNYWSDQDEDGNGGQLGFDWTNILVQGLSLHSSVRYTSGAFNEGVGFRATVRKTFRTVSLFTEYDIFRYEAEDLETGEDEDFARQSLRGGVDWRVRNWYFNLNTDYFFGDDDDAIGFSFFAEYRF